MYRNISNHCNKVDVDELSRYMDHIHVQLHGFGLWRETDIPGIESFIVPSFQIVYIHQGAARIIHNGIETICPAGSVYVFEPFQVYSAHSITRQPLEYLYMLFDIEPYAERNRFQHMILGRGDGLFFHSSFKRLGEMLSYLATDEQVALPGHAAMLKFTLIKLLINMARERVDNLQVLFTQTNPVTADLINLAVQDTEEHMQEPISIANLSKRLNVSENTLYKAFIQMTELSPSKFLTQYKIKKGEYYLRCEGKSIEEVSILLGYSSANHFSRTFKDVMGRSPREYLR